MDKKGDSMWVWVGIVICGLLILIGFFKLTWDFWMHLGEVLYGGSGFFGF